MGVSRRPGIPSVDPNIPQGIKDVLLALKENAEIANGMRSPGRQVGGTGYDGWRRRSVTLGMLVKAGVLTEKQAIELFVEP